MGSTTPIGTTTGAITAESAQPTVWPLSRAGRMLAEEIARVTAMPRPSSTAHVLVAAWQALTIYAHAGRALAATSAADAKLWRVARLGPSTVATQILNAPSMPTRGEHLSIQHRTACPPRPAWLNLPDPPRANDAGALIDWTRDLMCALGVIVGDLLFRHAGHASDPTDARICRRAGEQLGGCAVLWEPTNLQLGLLLTNLFEWLARN